MAQKNIIQVDTVSKTFLVGTQEIHVLKGINFDVEEGDFLIIVGPSGCGKSTLLHTMLGLEEPTSGKISFQDHDIYAGKTEDDRSGFRKKIIGMVYQQPNWIKSLTVVENVAFPLKLLGVLKDEAHTKAIAVLKEVEMDEWADYAPTELSSGQQQRIALARSLIHAPQVIIADEPTGNLDFESGQEMMGLLSKVNREQKKTIVMVTHDLEYLPFANKVVKMLDGQVENIYSGKEKDKLYKSSSLKRGSTNLDRNPKKIKSEKNKDEKEKTQDVKAENKDSQPEEKKASPEELLTNRPERVLPPSLRKPTRLERIQAQKGKK